MPSVASWVRDAIDELFGVNGRLPRSIRLLFWPPGELTLEWHRGKRAGFVRPFRLYLAAALLFFLAWPYTGFASGLEGFIQGFIDAGGASPAVVSDTSVQVGTEIVLQSLPGLLIILFVPLFAGLLHQVNERKGPFVGHLVMALHVHTVFFVGIVASAPLTLVLGERWGDLGEPVLFLTLFAFLCTSIARVYDVVAWRAISRTLVVMSAYSAVVATAMGGLLAIAL